LRGCAGFLVASLLFTRSLHAATVEVVNLDPEGIGFNDPSPPTLDAPQNPGLTVGEQKLFAVRWAADKLGALLYSPLPIVFEVSHDETLFCNANAATLAAAGPAWLVRLKRQVADHPDRNSWFPAALAQRLLGAQLFSEDVSMGVNPALGSPGCLEGFRWYYGLDNQAPSGSLPFVDTVLHELTHGLGFSAGIGADGMISSSDPDAITPYLAFAHDGLTNKLWWELSPEERAVSATSGLLTWTGPATRRAALDLIPDALDQDGNIYMFAPERYSPGSSLSHFAEVDGRALLMAPRASPNLHVQEDDIDLALEFLEDLGWREPGCGNGIVEDNEQCDPGRGNPNNVSAVGECSQACDWIADACPTDPDKVEPGYCGCGSPDLDSDGDGILDCADGCPANPTKQLQGICGCGVADTDSDGDQSPDCLDRCQSDPEKTTPGVCGCGVADVDGDQDGVFDCEDACPGDPHKVNPGQCGCGRDDQDRDGDGVADCLDMCPESSSMSQPGPKGCRIPDGAKTARPEKLNPVHSPFPRTK
jgi:hypothetical protein